MRSLLISAHAAEADPEEALLGSETLRYLPSETSKAFGALNERGA